MGHHTHTHTHLTSYVKIPGASLAPIVDALVSAELVERIQDPIRDNRPTYHPADPLIRFHYAVIRHHASRLSRHDADPRRIWQHLTPTFDSQVVGPCFEAMARYWAMHFADDVTLGGSPDHVGPTTLSLADGSEQELDVVVAAADAETAAQRTVLALGEANAGERISAQHLRRLEAARTALGGRASRAKLLLFGVDFTSGIATEARRRADVELVGLRRLFTGG